MPDVGEITIAITAEMAAELRAAMQDGYGSESDVIGEALHHWHLRRSLLAMETDRLRQLVQEGIDSGLGQEAAEVFAGVRKRLAAGQQG